MEVKNEQEQQTTVSERHYRAECNSSCCLTRSPARIYGPTIWIFQHVLCQEPRPCMARHFKNIGLQFPIPNTVILPPEVAEMLGLYNDDRATLTLSPLSEAHVVYFRKRVLDKDQIEQLPVFATGIELNGDQLDFNMTGTAITLVGWQPEGSFISPNTELVETDSTQVDSPNYDESADSVVTEAPKLQDSNSTDNNNKNNLLQ